MISIKVKPALVLFIFLSPPLNYMQYSGKLFIVKSVFLIFA